MVSIAMLIENNSKIRFSRMFDDSHPTNAVDSLSVPDSLLSHPLDSRVVLVLHLFWFGLFCGNVTCRVWFSYVYGDLVHPMTDNHRHCTRMASRPCVYGSEPENGGCERERTRGREGKRILENFLNFHWSTRSKIKNNSHLNCIWCGIPCRTYCTHVDSCPHELMHAAVKTSAAWTSCHIYHIRMAYDRWPHASTYAAPRSPYTETYFCTNNTQTFAALLVASFPYEWFDVFGIWVGYQRPGHTFRIDRNDFHAQHGFVQRAYYALSCPKSIDYTTYSWKRQKKSISYEKMLAISKD